DYILGQTIRVHDLRKDVWAKKKNGGERVTITLRTKLTQGSYSDLLYEINREVEILCKLHHPNLAHFYKMEESGINFGIIFKNLPGGSLWDYIQERKSLQEHEARELFAHLISGVGYLQKVGVIHYLIRPKNLLLDEHCRLVIHNFILARTFYPNNLLPKKGNDNPINGTMPEALVQESGYQFLQELMLERNGDSTYIAPEILGDSPYPAANVDIWSCGLVLYEMLTGFIFRTGPTEIQSAESLTYNNIKSDARPLFERLLVRDPKKRADVREIAGHAWLSQYVSVLDFVTSRSTTARDI
ncbi:kinase-like protein, partial [Cenococcum geophilum 1.58]|uniref:kinase-like protein n=1 Tax=Cenococcum geophilum 1.58 TaxID=794803 RepID=UPI00358F818B